MQEADPDVCLLAIPILADRPSHALNSVFPVARQRDVKFVIGFALNAGFISGSARYNYGKNSGHPTQIHRKAGKLPRGGRPVRCRPSNAALRFSQPRTSLRL